MRNKTYQILGQVIDQKNRTVLQGLRVEAWDSDMFYDDFVGDAVTDAIGNFRIEFTQSQFRELFFDRAPDLYFKIFKDTELIASTEDSVLWNVQAGDQEILIEVDPQDS